MGWIRLNDPLIKKLMKRKLRSYNIESNESLSMMTDNIDHMV